jgi:hypothetical protein
LGTAHLELTHVAQVEKARRSTHGSVFLNNPRILNWHQPTAKLDHPRPHLDVNRIKRSFV